MTHELRTYHLYLPLSQYLRRNIILIPIITTENLQLKISSDDLGINPLLFSSFPPSIVKLFPVPISFFNTAI